MLVVSDTSPLNYLVLVGVVDILPKLFGEVAIPPAVLDELQHLHAPKIVREWALSPPQWLQIRSPRQVLNHPKLDRGESEAIALVEEMQAGMLLVDERFASRLAAQRGIATIGTIAILAKAIAQDQIDRNEAVDRLARTNFRGPNDLLDKLVANFKHANKGNA